MTLCFTLSLSPVAVFYAQTITEGGMVDTTHTSEGILGWVDKYI